MSKIKNLHKFNLSCNKCNSNNITAREQFGLIELICLDCKSLNDNISELCGVPIENLNYSIQNLIKNNNNITSYVTLNQILEDSKKTLDILLKMLDNINQKNSDLCYRENVFHLHDELRGLNSLSFIYEKENSVYITLNSFKNPIYIDELKLCNINYDTYSLKLQIGQFDYECEIEDISFNEDVNFIDIEKLNFNIESLEKHIENLENLIKSL